MEDEQQLGRGENVAPFWIAAAFVAAFFISRPVAAQDTQRFPRADIVNNLATEWNEHQRAIGLTNVGTVVQLFTTDDGGTWTLVVTWPDGGSQIVGAGTHWQATAPVKGEGL